MADRRVAGQLRSLMGQQVPGLAIAVAGPEGLREAAAAGYADLTARVAASADMVCPWFSMTKIVTATLAMRLADRGLLDLDRPVLPLVPELVAMKPRPWAQRITPRHLLSHSAGFANPVPVRWIHPAGRPGPEPGAVIGEPAGRWVSLRRFLLDGAAYGGLLGPVHDVARFLQMHLRDGELDGARILAAESAAAMRRITINGRRFDLGLGWFRPASQRHADPPFVEHLGGGAGFFNLIRIYPTQEVGIAIMGNATKYDINAIASLA
jgi:CubicO group peptidase (beta-lactamase class C family)